MNETLVVIVRSLIGFFSLLIFARMLGKQAISQLTFFDYVLGITIGSIAATLSVDLNSRAWVHWISLLTWTIVVVILEYMTLHFNSFSKYVLGEPLIVIMNGKIMEEAMGKKRYTISDLLAQLRDKNIFDLNQVAFAILENNGNLSVLLKSDSQAVTRQDMAIISDMAVMPVKLIFNGILIRKNLDKSNLSEAEMMRYLASQGVKELREVCLLTIDSNGNFYLDLYQDFIQGG